MLPSSLSPPSIALVRLPGDPRESMEAARRLGFRAVTLDATRPGLRPREMDRSARRGLAATLRRLELRLAGLDLPIPPEHLARPDTQDRALAALAAACELLVECAALVETSPVIAAPEPMGEGDDEEARARESARVAGERAVNLGVRLAAPEAQELPPGWATSVDLARAIEAGRSPLKAISTAREVAMIRLTDADHAGRRPLGAGRVDVGQLAAVIATTAADACLVIDPAGLPDPLAGASAALQGWTDAHDPFARS